MDEFYRESEKLLQFIEASPSCFHVVKNVEEQLLGNDLLERKQEILDAKLHLTGGASC